MRILTETLDVSRFPTERLYGAPGKKCNLASVIWPIRTFVDDLGRGETPLVEKNLSFGFAMADPWRDYYSAWNSPYELVWFVGGWGPERDRYIANAVRKLRASARTQYNTLELRLRASELFRGAVESQEPDGAFAWGDYPWGGAVFLPFGGVTLLGAVSGLSEDEDAAIAAAILGLVGSQMHKHGGLPG